jgi:hypothetical protein
MGSKDTKKLHFFLRHLSPSTGRLKRIVLKINAFLKLLAALVRQAICVSV